MNQVKNSDGQARVPVRRGRSACTIVRSVSRSDPLPRRPPPPANPRVPTMRALAHAAALLMLVVVIASAWLRLAQPRAACADWPACRAAPAVAAAGVASEVLGAPPLLAAVRGTHRFAATAVLLAATALVALAFGRSAPRPGARALATLMLASAVGLAALGLVTAGSRSVLVLLGNLLGGQVLLALAWTLTRALADRRRRAGGRRRWARAGFVAWLVQAALGAASGAGIGPAVPVAHLGLAIVALAVALVAGLVARREDCRAEGNALLAVAAAQAALGLAAAASDAAPLVVLAHSAGGATGLALLLGLAGAGASDTGTEG
jgi:heme A synthase